MNVDIILDQTFLGEDSKNQFKATIESPDKLAAELCAFGNTDGGKLFIGINDQRKIVGIPDHDINRLNQLIANVSSHNISPPLYVKTFMVKVEDKRVMVIDVPQGINKPYEAAGAFWVKDGADKRKAKRDELFRLFQASGSFYADEMRVDASLDILSIDLFKHFYEDAYEEKFSESNVPISDLLANLKLATQDGYLTLAGLLLFSPKNYELKPQFMVKATHFAGDNRSTDNFIDKEDIGGTLLEQYKSGLGFIKRNLKRIQAHKDFNAPGQLEIPESAFAEALANALVHRDYFIQSQIMIELYTDRMEIISPGKLPNTVTEINIQYGVHIERNPIILTFMQKMKDFKYTGRGSGIPRILKACRKAGITVNLINDTQSEKFVVRFHRPEIQF